MALSYLPVDRDQLFLLPPSMREWLPEDHLVWLLIDVVDALDTSGLHARHPNDGVGRRAYDPDMLLVVLLYAYCTGQRSSRRIEQLCVVDVAFRVACGGLAPDHTTIARFRNLAGDVTQGLFVKALELCGEAGMVKVGVVAVDGTKMAGVGSLRANRTQGQIDTEVASMFAEAERTDQGEDARFGERRGDELPEPIRRPGPCRQERLRDAAESLARRRAAAEEQQERRRESTQRPRASAAHAEAELAELEAAEAVKAAHRRELADQGRRPSGRPPGPVPRRVQRARNRAGAARRAEQRREQQRATLDELHSNVTDPDSRIMKATTGFVQGYNAQAAVSCDGVVIAAAVTNDENDYSQCTPMMQAAVANLARAGVTAPPGTFLFDAGYHSAANLAAEGPDRLIADTKAWKLRRAGVTDDSTAVDPADPVALNHARLRSDAGAALYRQRQHTVEPVFGDVKANRGIRGFVSRGLAAVNAEWELLMAARNLNHLHRHRTT